MLSSRQSGTSALEDLVHRFDHAKHQFPYLDAVVIANPELMREEANEAAHRVFVPPPSPGAIKYREASDPKKLDWSDPDLAIFDSNDEARRHSDGIHRAIRIGMEWEQLYPASSLAGQTVPWKRRTYEQRDGVEGNTWTCLLIATSNNSESDIAYRCFSAIAFDFVQLGLTDNVRGPEPASSLLIHLADRDNPLPINDSEPRDRLSSRRQFLRWPANALESPYWVPAIQAGTLVTDWWAVRFENVFLYATVALKQFAISKPTRNSEPRQEMAKESQAPRELKEPNERALTAFRAYWILGMRQRQIADMMSKQLGKDVSQGQVSRWINNAKDWMDAGGVLPETFYSQANRPTPVDPEKLDMGFNSESRARHQRRRRTSLDDE